MAKDDTASKMKRKAYEKELSKLQVELCHLQEWVKARLRSTKTPQLVQFREEMPYNETGKLLRRVLRDELSGGRR